MSKTRHDVHSNFIARALVQAYSPRMSLIDLDAVRAARTARSPFDHFVAMRVLSADTAAEIAADFPRLAGPGLYPADEAGVRKSLIVNYVKPEWRARHELAYPGAPVAL